MSSGTLGTEGGCRGIGIHLRSTHALEQELQSELNEPWIVQLVVHESEARSAETGVWRSKLDTIKCVEELRPELQAKPVLRAKVRGLENRDVPVIDPRAAKRGIHTRFVAETPVCGSCEAAGIDPRNSRRRYRVGCALVASWYNIRTQ